MATPAPPVGPALGQHGVNIMEFCKAFNAATEKDRGVLIPVEITIRRSLFYFYMQNPPLLLFLIKQAVGWKKVREN